MSSVTKLLTYCFADWNTEKCHPEQHSEPLGLQLFLLENLCSEMTLGLRLLKWYVHPSFQKLHNEANILLECQLHTRDLLDTPKSFTCHEGIFKWPPYFNENIKKKTSSLIISSIFSWNLYIFSNFSLAHGCNGVGEYCHILIEKTSAPHLQRLHRASPHWDDLNLSAFSFAASQLRRFGPVWYWKLYCLLMLIVYDHLAMEQPLVKLLLRGSKKLTMPPVPDSSRLI